MADTDIPQYRASNRHTRTRSRRTEIFDVAVGEVMMAMDEAMKSTGPYSKPVPRGDRLWRQIAICHALPDAPAEMVLGFDAISPSLRRWWNHDDVSEQRLLPRFTKR